MDNKLNIEEIKQSLSSYDEPAKKDFSLEDILKEIKNSSDEAVSSSEKNEEKEIPSKEVPENKI